MGRVCIRSKELFLGILIVYQSISLLKISKIIIIMLG